MSTFNFLFQIIDELLTFNPLLVFKDLFRAGGGGGGGSPIFNSHFNQKWVQKCVMFTQCLENNSLIYAIFEGL